MVNAHSYGNSPGAYDLQYPCEIMIFHTCFELADGIHCIMISGQFQCMPETGPFSTQTPGFLSALGYGKFQFLSTVAFVGRGRGLFRFDMF